MTSQINDKVIDIELYKQCNQNKITLINPYAYGDVLLVCGFKDAIEDYYKAPVHFVIKPEHEIIMQLYGITDYSIKRFEKDELKKIQKKSKLEAGCLFIAHPAFINDNKRLLNSFCKSKFSFVELFRKTFNLPENAEFKKPKNIPTFSDELKEKLTHIAPLNKIILFSPESFSTPRIMDIFWESKAKDLQEEGYTVISSVKEKKSAIKGTIYLPLTFEEALAIAMNCADVYTIRSGFADVVVQYINKITILYPNVELYDAYNFQYLNQNNIKEMVIYGSIVKKCGPCFQTEHKGEEKMFRFCLTLLRIKKRRDKTKYCVLGIPIWIVKYASNYKKGFLFGVIPIYKGAI